MELSTLVVKDLMDSYPSLDDLRRSKIETVTEIPVVNEPIPYDIFYANYLVANQPVILGKWFTDDWSSRLLWLKPDGSVQWEMLTELFGSATVPVADCTKEVSYSHPKLSMKFEEFISYMRNKPSDGHEEKLLYLKDWHFQRDFPSYSVYATPVYFQSDWLNEFWDSRSDCHDDYRFLYFGPQGSWTPFHADVFRSFSWSANVFGKKRWILCPAGSEEKLRDDFGRLPFDIETATLEARGVKYFDVVQNAGEVMFIPSGWFHQVFNLEDTLSINHNWMNASNVDICWKFLSDSLVSVEREISEHRETMDNWTEHCQLFLRADVGYDFVDFFNLLRVVGGRRLARLQKSRDDREPDGAERDLVGLETNHAVYDLFRISEIVAEMIRQTKIVDILEIGRDRLLCSPVDFMNQLQNAIDNALST